MRRMSWGALAQSVSEPITLSGTFALVRDDPRALLYRLNEATLVDTNDLQPRRGVI